MLKYQSGFNNYFESEAIPGALPVHNSPQKHSLGLYAEQFSGTSFSMARAQNLRTWLYRINPSVKHGPFKHIAKPDNFLGAPINTPSSPNQMRWNKLDSITKPTDFVNGWATMMANGNITELNGSAIHIYRANESMQGFFYNADGELLIIPQEGKLLFRTELGELEVGPLEIIVIPRGLKFQVILLDKYAYGYINENYGSPYELPELGPIGANGLANTRDFLAPTAKYENVPGDFNLVAKFEGELWRAKLTASPLDVVAWHGNYVPYKYDLRKFNTLGTVSFDHPDPSIFTVLTSRSSIPGMPNVDFVIFPPRWMVAEHTFRPPWYHRNIMSEFMGLLLGQYDAKPDGFVPGGSSLHNRMAAHGPDSEACIKAINKTLQPEYLDDTMAFMFESYMTWKVSQFALQTKSLQQNYQECWQNIPILFNGG